MDYEVKDILNDIDYLKHITNQAAKIHPENFQYFSNRISGYTNFFVIKMCNKVVAMSGIWRCSTWPSNYYRVGDRSFYFPSIRQFNLSNPHYKPYKTFNSQVLIPMQTKLVLKNNGVPFYSMLNHPNALKRSISLVNKVSPNKYKLLNGLYWTCSDKPNKDNKRCWQNIAVINSFNNNFELPRYE